VLYWMKLFMMKYKTVFGVVLISGHVKAHLLSIMGIYE
jgi:hypothetical protein